MYGNENATYYLPCLVCAEIQLEQTSVDLSADEVVKES